jgi:hypothetical protein
MTVESKTTAHLEGRVEQLEGAVSSVSKDLKDLSTGFNVFKEELLGKIGSMTAPKWPIISIIATFIVMVLGLSGTIVSLIMSGHQAEIQANQHDLRSLEREFSDQNIEHGQWKTWSTMVDKNLFSLDEKLQREMNLINITTESKIKGLDDKLQAEFGYSNKIHDTSTTDIKETIANLKNWRLSIEERYNEAIGKLNAKQEMVLDELKKVEARQYDQKQK